MLSTPIRVRRYTWFLVIAWTALGSVALAWTLLFQQRETLQTANHYAQATLKKDQIHRQWAAMHGGVYVEITEDTPPSPYLAHVPERDVTTASGRSLTLMNPAYMTRQMHELEAEHYGLRGHLTSLKPLRPENTPDDWEREALRAFERGANEVSSIAEVEGSSYLRVMRPMITEEQCLRCHRTQGYKVGDVCGGVSVSVPMEPLWAIARTNVVTTVMGYGCIWLIGIAGIVLFTRKLHHRLCEQQRIEETLRANEDKFRSLFELSSDAVMLLDDKRVLDCNEATLHTFGYTNNKEFLGKHPAEFSPPKQPCGTDSMTLANQRIATALQQGSHQFEWLHQHTDGRLFLADVLMSVVTLEGHPILQAVVRDISERKRAEEERERLFLEIQKRIKEQTCIYEVSRSVLKGETLEDVFLDVAAIIPSGWKYPEITRGKITLEGKQFIVEPFEETEWKQVSDIIIDGQRCGSVEVYYLQERPELDEGPFMKEERCLLDGIARFLSEAIARKRSEAALQRSIQDLDDVTANMPSGTVWKMDINPDGLFENTYSSSGTDRLLGLPEGTIHHNVDEWFSHVLPEDLPRVKAAFGQLVATVGSTDEAEYRMRNADGEIVWMCSRASSSPAEGAVHVTGFTLDITARKRAEEAVQQQQYYLEKAQELGRIGTWELDLRRNKLYWTDENCRIFGVPSGSVVNYEVFLAKVHPDDREYVAREWKAALDGKPYDIEHRIVYDGITKWVREKADVEFDEESTAVKAIGFTQDVTERKQTEQQIQDYAAVLESNNLALEELKQAAEAATQSKSDFLANMSHEIRTPMTAILGFSDVLQENLTGCSKCVEHGSCELRQQNQIHIETISTNGKYLIKLINDILDVSKIEAGKLEVERISCSPCQILSDVVSLMQVRANAKNLPLKIEYDGPIPQSIQSDPTRLRQILINLTGNAVKFTEVGKVHLVARLLDAESDEPKMQFEVVDSGIGLTEEQIAKLFTPFSQADSSTTRKFGGTGLGLTISKRLAGKLGGDISVRSVLGEGSTFTVTVGTGPLDGVKLFDNPTEAQLPADPDKKPTALETKLDCRVLLAEDGPDNQRLIAFLLKKTGAEVALAENGQIAYDLALAARDEGNPFDVILMDMQMPVMDGYDATGKLREAGYTGPIIALTAHAMNTDRDKCLNAGCDDYATKPIDRNKLISVVAEHASQQELHNASDAPVA